MTDLTTLSRRVSEAEGPSRELDDAIAVALGWAVKLSDLSVCYEIKLPGIKPYLGRGPSYTASLDAVAALIAEKLPGAHILVAAGPDNAIANVSDRDLGQFENRWYPQGKGKTECLARLSAALLAIYERNKSDDEY